MANGMGQQDAHFAALEQLGHSGFDTYGAEVIGAFPEEFNDLWF